MNQGFDYEKMVKERNEAMAGICDEMFSMTTEKQLAVEGNDMRKMFYEAWFERRPGSITSEEIKNWFMWLAKEKNIHHFYDFRKDLYVFKKIS